MGRGVVTENGGGGADRRSRTRHADHHANQSDIQDKVRKTSSQLVRKARRRKRELKLEAAAELNQAKSTIKSNFRSAGWWYSIFKLSVVVLAYFSTSVALTFYQKDLIVALPFPLIIVTCHLVIKFVLALLCRAALSKLCQKPGSNSSQSRRNRRLDESGDESHGINSRTVLPWDVYMKRVAPVGVASAWDIGFSQWSLKYVTVALYTMTKTTSILFIMILGIVFKLERKHWSQVLIVGSISVGIGLFTHKSTAFSMVGFVMCLTASLMCGFRWTLSQKIMQKSQLGLENPIDMIYHVQPLMIIAVLPLAVGMEGLAFAASSSGFRYQSSGQIAHTAAVIGGGGILAFFMELFEYLIITIGSSLTLAIIGVSKEIVTVSVSLARNHTRLSPINSIGMAVCLVGIVAHVGRKAAMTASDKQSQSQHPDSRPGRSNHPRTSGDTMELGDFGFSESSDEGGTTVLGGNNTAGGNSGPYTPVPLLDSDWSTSSSDNEGSAAAAAAAITAKKGGPVKSSSSKGGNWKAPDDDFFLSENRTWTSVKDSHLQQIQSTTPGGATSTTNGNSISISTGSTSNGNAATLLSD